MRIKKNKKLLILMLVIVGIFSLSLTFKSYSNKIVDNVEDVKDVSNIKRKQFSMYVENDSGEYDEYNSSELFPIGYKLNLDKSTCVDINGSEVKNVLSGNGNAVTVTSNKTVFCYVYFDLVNLLSKYIKDNPTSGFNTSIEAGLYRYQGTNDVVTNNYVCFGTGDKDTCINDTDKYMYRIIGIDENNQIKLIKNTSIGDYMWHNVNVDISWPESDLYKGLNGIDGGYYTDIFVNNSTYTYMNENSNWYNKIVNYSWKYGNAGYSGGNGNSSTKLNEIETNFSNTVTAKIGIWYVHDYNYAYISGGNGGSVDNMSKTWIYHKFEEWFMTRRGEVTAGIYVTFNIGGGPSVYYDILSGSHPVRPTFFLENNAEYSSGTGTITDPFLIKE